MAYDEGVHVSIFPMASFHNFTMAQSHLDDERWRLDVHERYTTHVDPWAKETLSARFAWGDDTVLS